MNQKEFNDGYNAFIESLKNSGGKDGKEGGGRGSGKTGTVSTDDCTQIGGTGGVGGVITSDDGNKIVKKEGHEVEGGTDSQRSREWGDAGKKLADGLKASKNGALDHLRAKLGDLYRSKTNWKKALKDVVGSFVNNDEESKLIYAKKKPLAALDDIQKRAVPDDDSVGYIAAFIDSSGSMSQEQLVMCLNEIYAVALAKKPMKLLVVQCDTAIEKLDIYKSLAEMKKSFKKEGVHGGGGTDLTPCWNLLCDDPRFNKVPVELVMVFTDGGLFTWDGMERDPKHMRALCWCFIDAPGFTLPEKCKERKTRTVYLNSDDIK